MTKHAKFFLKDKALKQSLFLSFGVMVFLFMFWYVNKYIYEFRAAYPIANLIFTPSTYSVNAYPPNEVVDHTFGVGFNISGQKVTAIELYAEYDPAYLEYYKEYMTGTGFGEIKADPSKENYFDVPLIEEISSPSANIKRLRMVLVSKFNDPANPNWLTNAGGVLKFRAKKAGTTTITVNKTMTMLAGVNSTGDATYFDLPSNEIKATVNISAPNTTITTTPPAASGTISPTISVNPSITITSTISPTATRTPTPTTSVTPTRIPTIPTGGYQDVTLNFKLRFQGMADKGPADQAVKKIPVYVALLGDNRAAQNNLGMGTLEFTAQGNGVWTSSVTARIDTSRKWNLFIKGPKHLRKRICTNVPQEPIPGGYQCPTELSVNNSIYQMTFKAGTNEVDLSNILLLAGDLPIQNGIIDAVDVAFIRANMGSQDQATKARADLNYDGIIDAQDYSLIIASLAFKYDEE